MPVFDGTSGNDIEILADWNTRIAAVDGSKIIVTPLFDSLVLPVSESIVEGGGDNTTIFGLPNLQGEGNVIVDGIRLKNLNTAIKAAFEEAGYPLDKIITNNKALPRDPRHRSKLDLGKLGHN